MNEKTKAEIKKIVGEKEYRKIPGFSKYLVTEDGSHLLSLKGMKGVRVLAQHKDTSGGHKNSQAYSDENKKMSMVYS